MAIKYGGIRNFQLLAESSGEELFENWLKLGSLAKTCKLHNSKYPDDQLKYLQEVRRRILVWISNHSIRALEIMKEINPNIPDDKAEEIVLYYVVRQLSYDRLLIWADKNPWAKKYEADYSKFYAG